MSQVTPWGLQDHCLEALDDVDVVGCPDRSDPMYARGMAMISATGWPAPPHSQQHHQHRATATGHQCGAVGCSVRLAQRSAGDEGRPIAIAGELLADEMVTGDRSPLLAAFRPGRFR
jgi:hypothetical protein